jgi:hypothetical protein
MSAAVTIIGAVIAAAASAYGSYKTSQDVDKAQAESKRMYEEEQKRTDRNDRFNRSMSARSMFLNEKTQAENLALSKDRLALEQDRFGLSQTSTGFNMVKDMVGQTEKLLNSNVGLKNLVLQRWGGMGGRR